MPATLQDILDQAMAPYGAPDLNTVGVAPPPAGADYFQAAANADAGVLPQNATDVEKDLNNLSPIEFTAKYGERAPKILSDAAAGRAAYSASIASRRSAAGLVNDAIKGALGTTASGLVGLAGVGVGQVAPDTGARIAKAANDITTFTEGHQSDALQLHREAAEARHLGQTQADAAAYKADLDRGESYTVAKFNNFGRTLIHGIKNAADDPMLLEQGTVDNAGALGINYALTVGLGALADVIAPTTRAAAAAEAVVEDGAQGVAKLPAASKFLATKAIPMASQGILMGGMAYQQAVGEVMGRSFDDLKQNSQVYREAYDNAKLTGMSDSDAQEEARTHTAGIAGRQAALIAAPLAAATTHISHMSENLFNVDTIPGSLAEIGKQGLEGGLVNMSQTLAGNIATKNVVDPNTELDAGLGKSTGEGALYGVTAAAGLQAPGLAVKGTKATASATLNGLVHLLNDHFTGSSKAIIDAENEKTPSPVNPKTVVADTNAVLQAAPVAIQDAKTEVAGWDMPEEMKQFHIKFIEDFHKAAEFNPATEITNSNLPEFVGKPLEGVTNRMDAVDLLADAATTEQDPERKIQLVSAMQEVMAPLDEFRYSKEILSDAPKDSPTRKLIESYMNLADSVERMHSVKDATEAAKEIFEHRDPEAIQPLTESEIGTETEYKKVDDAIANARISPETGNLKAIDAILAHADAGQVFITPDQRKLLMGSKLILEAQKKLLDAKKVNGVIPDETTRVSSEILTDSKPNRDTGALSAVQYFNNIYGAMRSGKLKLAKQELADMGLFTQHMKNKAQAFNTGIESNSPKSVPYMALAPRSIGNADGFGVRHWYTSTNNLGGRDPYVMNMKAKSVQQAHDVFNDHHALTSVYNGLTEAFPELGESKIAPLQIHPALAGDTSARIAQQFETGTRKVADFKAEYEAQQEADRQQQVIFDRKAPAESIVSRNMPEAQKPVPVQEAPVKAETAKPEPVEKTNPTPAPEPTPEQAPEPVTEPVAEPVTEPVTEPVKEEVPAPETAPEAAPVEEPVEAVEPKVESSTAAEAPVQTESETETEPVAEPEPAPTSELGPNLPGYLDSDSVAAEKVRQTGSESEKHLRPNLVKSVINRFYPSYEIRGGKSGEAPTRVLQSVSPVADIRHALTSAGTLGEFAARTGSKLRQHLSSEAAAAYQKFLAGPSSADHADLRDTANGAPQNYGQNARWMNFGGLVTAIHKNLNTFLERPYSKDDQRSMKVWLQEGLKTVKEQRTINQFAQGKVLNIVEPHGESGSFAYNQNLLETAVMAGMDWFLRIGHGTPLVTDDDIKDITGMEVGELPNDDGALLNALRGTYSILDMKRGITSAIREFWGVKSIDTADKAYADGIVEAMAGEVMHGMVNTGFFRLEEPELGKKQFTRFRPNNPAEPTGEGETIYHHPLEKQFQELYNYPGALADAVVVDPKQVSHFGTDEKLSVATHQIHSDTPNAKGQMRAIDKANQIVHKLDLPMLGLYFELGHDLLNDYFGGGSDVNTLPTNKADRKSREGMNLTIGSAAGHLEELVGQMWNRAAVTGEHLADMVIRYEHNMSSVGRLQKLGANNPEASKLTREVIMPTWSTLDLKGNMDHQRAFDLAVAQAVGMGIKVESLPPEDARAELQKRLKGPLRPVMEMLEAHVLDRMANETLHEAPRGPMHETSRWGEALRDALLESGVDMKPVALHALYEQARLNVTDEADKKNFRTSLYLEADGKTNGIANALGMIANGVFTAPWVTNIQKAGFSLGSEVRPLHTLYAKDPVDLYKTAAGAAQSIVAAYQNIFKASGSPHVMTVSNSLVDLMHEFLPGVTRTGGDAADRGLEIERAITKQPSQMTVYGAGEGGVAKNLTGEMLTNMYARMTKALRAAHDLDLPLSQAMFPKAVDHEQEFSKFVRNLNIVFGSKIQKNFETDRYETSTHLVKHFSLNPKTFDLAEYEATPNNFTTLAENMHQVLAKPLVEAIHDTIGRDVMEASKFLQESGNKHSMVYAEYIRSQVRNAVAERSLNDPTFSPGDFLSEADFDKILEKAAPLAPLVHRGDEQNFMLIKSAMYKDLKLEYSKTLDGRWGTSPDVRVPGYAGVSSIAKLVLGNGDGSMIQDFLNGPTKGEDSLLVFDGVHMPLDKIDEYSREINRNALDAWMNNPMKSVRDAYITLLKNSDMIHDVLNQQYTEAQQYRLEKGVSEREARDEKMILAKALLGSIDREMSIHDFGVDQLHDLLLNNLLGTGRNLNYYTASIDARHAVLREEGLSSDQMASAAVGYHNGMKSTVDMSSPDATAADLTARYNDRYTTLIADLPKIPEPKTYAEYLSHRDKETSLSASEISAEIKNAVDSIINFDTTPAPDLSRTQSTDTNLGIDGAEAEAGRKPTSPNMNLVKPGEAPEPSPEREAFRALTQQVGRADSKTGVRLLSQTAIKNLIRIMEPTDTQRRVLSEIFRSGSAKDFKVVSGTPDEIARYSDNNNSATYADMQSKYDGKLNGFISFAEKRIYLVNPSAETLTHELIHASTYANVLAHYSGETLHPEVHAAVKRLEELMHAFIHGEITGKDTPPELSEAYEHSLGAIMDELFNEKQPDDAVKNAGALNEFMAWTLSNAALAKRLETKDRTTQLALGKFTSLAKYVVNSIKDMFWKSRGQRPPAVGDDMLSDIKFHTSILMREPPSGTKMFAESTLRHFEQDRDQHLADIRDNLTRKVVRSIESMMAGARTKEQKGDAEQLKEEFIRSAALPDEANRLKAFFPMTMNESTTFSVVSAAFQFHNHLDPTFVSRAQELYDHVMKHISASDIPDGALNFDENGPSNAMPAFMALALVNKDFAKSLESIPMIKAAKSTQESRVDRAVENMFNNSMNWISGKLASDSHSKNVLEAVNALRDRINLEAMDEDTYLKIGANKLGGVSDTLNNLGVNVLGHLSDKGMALAKRMDASESAFARHTAGLVHVLSGQLSDKNGDTASESLLKLINVTRDAPVLNMMKKTAVDLIGRTSANAGVYDMIKQIKSTVDQLRQRYLTKIPPLLEGKFTVAPDKEAKTHMFFGVGKADLASMLETHSTKDALNLLADPSARAALIEKRENQIREVDPQNWDLYQRKMNQLAHYLMTGEHGLLMPRNAYGIAKLLGERGDINRKMLDPDVVQHIDQLTTLYALERMNKLNPDRQEALSSLVQKEPAGMAFMLDYLKNLRQGELDKIGDDTVLENNHWKGHIPSQVEMGSDLRVAPDSEAGKMRLMGFTRIRPYLGSGFEPDSEPQSYFRAPLRGTMAFAQGIMQNIDHTVSGADAVTGFSMHQVAGRILNPTKVAEITARLQRASEISQGKSDFVDARTEHLIPVYNANDEIYAYERAMDPEMLAMRKPSTDITQMAGVWQGRQVEESMAREFNHALIDRTHEMYLKDGEPQDGPDSAYINVLDRSQTNQIQKDAVRLFNDDAMNYIEQKYGPGRFMIRKDLVEDVIGSRHASIGDMWTGNSNWTKKTQDTVRDTLVGLLGPDAFKHLVTGERFVQGAMSDLRHNIAVKMLSIPVMRAVNNVYQLIGRGVPLAAITRGTATKMQEITLYNKSRDREIELEAELKSSAVANDPTRATWLKAELRSIRDSYQRMSIHPLIKNGEYATIDGIGEGVESDPGNPHSSLKAGKVMTWLEEKVNKLPPQIRTVARYGILSRDTALYAGLERLAEYSDFVAKGIYYDDLVKRKGFTSEQALGRITEEYVNFDRNPGRSRAYTDRMGLTWFLNYKIRIAKVALSMMRNNPFHAIVSAAAPAFPQVGNVFEDNIFSKIMDGDIKYSIGPGMAAHGLTIAPWFNLAR